MISPWLRWKVQGFFFLLGKDFFFSKWKVIQTWKILQYLQILELVSQDNTKTKQNFKCFHQELEVKMFTVFHVLIITFNSLSLEM